MTERGVVVEAHRYTFGGYVATDASAGATSLDLDSALNFSDLGGQLTIDGAGYSYGAVDFDTSPDVHTITGITPPLAADAVAGDRVDVAPAVVEMRASVMTEYADDAMTVLVPHTLMDRIAEGIRADDEREVVLFDEVDNRWVLVDVLGRVPVIDGSFIDPTTLPEPVSDGLPPASSPTPTATGGPGFVLVRWTPIANHDTVTYHVHVDDASGFTPDGTNLLISTTGSTAVYRPSPPDYEATYYFKIVAEDEDDPAAPSVEASAQLVQVNSPDIAANYVYAGNIFVDQLVSGTLTADVLLSSTITTRGGGAGAGLDLTQDLVRYDSAGVPTAILGDKNTFKGDAELENVTVTGGIAVRNTMSEISKGAQVHLRQGTTAPQSAPSAIVGWADPIVIDKFSGNYGLVWTGSEWATVSVLPGGGTQVVERSSSGDVTLDSFSNQYAWGGIVLIGSNWYTLEYNTALTDWWISKYNSSGTLVDEANYVPIAGNFGSGGNHAAGLAPAAIGTDGTNLLIAEFDDANNRFRVQTRSTTTLAVTSTMNTSANAGFTGPVVGVRRGNFDFGSERTIILTKNGAHFYPFDAGGTYQPNDAWAVPGPGTMSGFDWVPSGQGPATDDNRFWSTRAKHLAGNPWLYKHTEYKWSGADPLTHHARSTWRDTDATGGTHESDMSPAVSFAMKKRASLTLSSPTIPDSGGSDDPNAVAFYLSNTDTARTSMWRQTLPADGVNTLVVGDGIAFSGTNPPSSNNFPGATPGQIDNLPLTSLEIKGDGSIKAASLNLGLGSTIGDIYTGTVTATTDGTGKITINHPLGVVPTAVFVGAQNSGQYAAAAVPTSSSVDVFVRNILSAGAPVLTSTSVTIRYLFIA